MRPLHPIVFVVSELAEFRERDVNASMYYKETFGITPEQALENSEKLRQMEELVASLEAEVQNKYLMRINVVLYKKIHNSGSPTSL